MEERQLNPAENHNDPVEDQLERERVKSRALEAKVADLEQQVGIERANLKRLSSRKSVKAALRVAGLGASILEVVRRRRVPPTKKNEPADQRAVVAALQHHRSELGPGEGPLVTVVVLNRNGAHHLARLLPGLRDQTHYRSFELVVVDNASTDDSNRLLDQDWGFPIRTITNDTNVSFSRGCNQGLAVANGEYTLLLNNDIAPINSGWLGALVNSLQADPSVGAAGSLLIYPERPGYQSGDPNTGADLTVQHRGIRFQWRRNAPPEGTVPWAYNVGVGEDPTDPELAATRLVAAATAACLLTRTDLLRDLGGLDEGFTYGMEDVDLCLRIRDAGYSVAYVGAAALFHHEFGTQSKIEQARRREFGLANVRHFSAKWSARLGRQLDLEALYPTRPGLRDREHGLICLVGTESLNPQNGEALEEALRSAEHPVVSAASPEDGATILINLDPELDTAKVPADTLTIGWIAGDVGPWTGAPAVDSHDVYVPATNLAADALKRADLGSTAPVALAPAGAKELLNAVRDHLLRPVVGVNVRKNDEPAATAILRSLQSAQHTAVLRTADEWDAPASQCVDIVVHLHGSGSYEPRPSHRNVLLGVDDAPSITARDCDGYDLILVATDDDKQRLQALTNAPVRVAREQSQLSKAMEDNAVGRAVNALEWTPDLSFCGRT